MNAILTAEPRRAVRGGPRHSARRRKRHPALPGKEPGDRFQSAQDIGFALEASAALAGALPDKASGQAVVAALRSVDCGRRGVPRWPRRSRRAILFSACASRSPRSRAACSRRSPTTPAPSCFRALSPDGVVRGLHEQGGGQPGHLLAAGLGRNESVNLTRTPATTKLSPHGRPMAADRLPVGTRGRRHLRHAADGSDVAAGERCGVQSRVGSRRQAHRLRRGEHQPAGGPVGAREPALGGRCREREEAAVDQG